MKPFAAALKSKRPKENIARLIEKSEGFVYVDLDKVRHAETGEVEPWAEKLISELATYTEISASGEGFHLVARGVLSEDYSVKGVRVELKSGNTPNRLFTLTGDIYNLEGIEPRQAELDRLLRGCKVGHYKNPTAETINWRTQFHTVDELPDGDIRFLIDNVLPEGVSFIGALSGVGKTWFCLSMARALTTGKKFLGNYGVPEPVNVLYLCPEMNAKTFKKRCKLFGIIERFFCQTIADGGALNLYDPVFARAVAELKPVVFLDTAIRFAGADDENSSSQNNNGLAKAVFTLIHLGAQAVVCLHHRAKDTANKEELTLENTLRGTGDLGAICDCVWGLRYDKGPGDQYAKESKKLVRLEVTCVKARDFVLPEPFNIQLEGFIHKIGDFAVLEKGQPTVNPFWEADVDKINDAITANPKIEKTKLEEDTGIGRNRQEALAAEKGWSFDKKTKWTRARTMAGY